MQRRADCRTLGEARREDVMCLALNQLPSRYYRDEARMERYLSDDERREMEMSAEAAVEGAMDYLSFVETEHHGGETG
jgi:hypothetical protein